MQAERGEGIGAFREGGYGERERKTSTKKQQHFKTFWEKQVVNGLKNNCRGGGAAIQKWPLVGGPTVFWTPNQEEGQHRGTSHAPPIRIQHRPREP